MTQFRIGFIYLAIAIAVIGAAIHVATIFAGVSWYVFFGAPPAIVESARAGTWLAPVSTVAVAGLMALCAVYGCSAIGLTRRLPLLRPALACIAALCLIRGLFLVPVVFMRPDLLNAFEVVAAVVFALAGVGFAFGFNAARPVA